MDANTPITFLKVGQNPPGINSHVVHDLASRLYGLTVVKYDQLNGYDDKNYHIFVQKSTDNPFINTASDDGYVLKILNSMDSKTPGITDGQQSFMDHLRNDGIRTSKPMPNIHGQLKSLERLSADGECPIAECREYVVRLFAYIPGKMLVDVTYTPQLLFEAGQLLGKIHTSAKGFHHPFYDTYKTVWDVAELHRLKDFIHAVKDDTDRQNVEEVMEEFQNEVVSKYDQLRKGMLHGDPNEQNILVRKSDADREYHVFGVLDFSDTMLSYSVFDIGKMIAYLMLDCISLDKNDVGGYVLAGYDSVLKIPELELQIMKICVKARLAQTIVLGLYTYTLTPENTYLLTTGVHGWRILRELHCGDSRVLLDRWMSIMRGYHDK